MTSSEGFRAVAPVRPAAPYVGGKRHLAAHLCARIAAIPHKIYAEPFVGMGGVFLRRRQAAPLEVINDSSRDVATLFRILQRHYPAFADELKWRFTSRAEFERLMATDPSTLTDLERAARFLYLQRTGFGGKVAGRSFGVTYDGRGGRFDVGKLGEVLPAIAERLAGVVIENLDWRVFLARYDRPETLFYLDPPYLGSEEAYGAGAFPREDFAALAAALAAIEGRFVLSINDTAETRALFSRFALAEVEVAYGIGAHAGTPSRFGELIVTN